MSRAAEMSFFFFLLLLSSGALGDPRDDAETEFDLLQFLEKAHELGLVNERQQSELRQLALEMAAPSLADSSTESKREGLSQGFSEVFLRTYDQFSLLNVLYFSGSLLVMGAFTLFSTVAWKNLGYGGVTLVLLVPLLLSGFVGVRLWEEGSYPVLGGLLCTVSTTMIPFTVYCLQRALNWWPSEDPGLFQGFRTKVRGGWIVMEVATILTGFSFLLLGVHFPFLLFPVSWMLWFLSMDLAPLFPQWSRSHRGLFETRRTLSVGFGLAMLVVGRSLEVNRGSDPDFGFWLYLFGLMSFWFAITFDFPEYDLHGSLYLLINISISLAGSHLNRTTFHVFATAGILLYTGGVFVNYIRPQKSLLLWILKALAVVGLFSQALRTGGSIEIVIAVACLAAFGYSFLPHADSGLLHHTVLLVTTLGFVGCAAAFQRPLNLWFFDLPSASWLVGLATSLSVLLYHTRLVKYHFSSPAHFSLTEFSVHVYRVVVSVGVALVFVFLRQPWYAWVGGLGVPLVAANLSSMSFFWISRPGNRDFMHFKIASLIVLIVGVLLSLYVESNVLYLVTCVVLLAFILTQLNDWKVTGTVFSVLLVLLSVPLQSRFLMVIGALYIFIYLTDLAYDRFKNSIMFSLSLIGLGVTIIYLGYLYQTYEALVQEKFDYLTPNFVRYLLTRPLSHDWTPFGRLDWFYVLQKTEFSYDSFTGCPHCWLLWPAPLMHALAKGTLPYVATMSAVGVFILLGALAVLNIRRSFIIDLHDSVKVTSLTMSLSGGGNGMVVKMKGTKPAELTASVTHVAADVSGRSFWGAASDVFGGWKVSFFRSVFLPLTLTPHLISFVGFTDGSREFSATVLLGTGQGGGARVSHSTIIDTLNRLRGRNSTARVTCILLYSGSWYSPYSKLTEREVSLEDIVL